MRGGSELEHLCGLVRDAKTARTAAVINEILRDCDADLARVQGKVRAKYDAHDLGCVRARLARVRDLIAGAVPPEK
jgi:hypothetical protein